MCSNVLLNGQSDFKAKAPVMGEKTFTKATWTRKEIYDRHSRPDIAMFTNACSHCC